MSITITSTTDSNEAVTAATGDLAKKETVVEKKSAPVETKPADETPLEASEALETDESDTEDENALENDKANEDGKVKKPKGFKKRIDKLNKKLSAAEQEREYWRGEALKKGQTNTNSDSTQTDKQLTAQINSDGKPRADDFKSHDDFVEALAEWKLEKKLSEREAKTKESQLKTEHQKKIETHVAKIEEFKKTHADFDDLMEDADDIPMSITVQQSILDSENGPELMYLLAKNRDEYERICKLPAIAAARELGKFEAKFLKAQDSSVETKQTTTKAPKPIKTVGTTATGSGKKSLDDPTLGQREYERLREEQEKALRA